jgi:hypothetical protein
MSISPDDAQHEYLDVAQLIKHMLGLKEKFGKSNFRLLYLWYDAFGYEGWRHRDEIARYMEVAKSDGIAFHELSYQELIARLADNYRTTHPEYIEYISGRYL